MEREQRTREPGSEMPIDIQLELWVGQPQDAMALPSKLDVLDNTPPTRVYTVYPFSKIQPLCSVYVVKDLEPCLVHKLIKMLLTLSSSRKAAQCRWSHEASTRGWKDEW